ncbi:MAG: SMI1/KNR4 family protein [Cyanobacteria bacterium P01_G01_bin.39]
MKNINFNSNQDFHSRAKAIKNIMLELNIAKAELIRGCSQSEIENLEQEHNVMFPESYKIFLSYFGHGLGGKVMSDIEILYDDISGLTNELRNETLIEEGDPILPDKAFVFASRLGEQYMFFDASGILKEPPILYYKENAPNFSLAGNSIFDVLEREVQLSYNLKLKLEN